MKKTGDLETSDRPVSETNRDGLQSWKKNSPTKYTKQLTETISTTNNKVIPPLSKKTNANGKLAEIQSYLSILQNGKCDIFSENNT